MPKQCTLLCFSNSSNINLGSRKWIMTMQITITIFTYAHHWFIMWHLLHDNQSIWWWTLEDWFDTDFLTNLGTLESWLVLTVTPNIGFMDWPIDKNGSRRKTQWISDLWWIQQCRRFIEVFSHLIPGSASCSSQQAPWDQNGLPCSHQCCSFPVEIAQF